MSYGSLQSKFDELADELAIVLGFRLVFRLVFCGSPDAVDTSIGLEAASGPAAELDVSAGAVAGMERTSGLCHSK